MNAVDFYKLPRAIQDRFVGSVQSGFPPAPLLVLRGGTPKKFLWLALTPVCFVALVVAARLGYGSLDSVLSMHSAKVLPLYVALSFGVIFGLVQAFAQLVRERALPYAPGVYLFPACLIDARSEKFKIHLTQDLASVDLQSGGRVRVSFAGGHAFVFTLVDPQGAPQVAAEIYAARDRAMHARATEEPKELVAVDPLHVPRFSSPVGPRDPYALKLPPWGRFGWAVGAIFALALGPSLWALRNSGSDKKMYARATRANDTTSYRQYLVRGQAFKEETAGILLPRAELKDAIQAGTVEALLAYRKAHPSSKIEGEVSAAIRTAMLAELDKAKAKKTLAALTAFDKQYPDHGVDKELRAAIHAVYMRELAAYQERAPKKSKKVGPFVERLFAWAEKHGARVEVRLRRKTSDSLERADKFVGKSRSFMGAVSYPSRYFDEAHATPREQALGQAIAAELDAGLSPELFDVVVGAPVPVDADLPKVDVPTLFLTHRVEWSGQSYTSRKPRGSYVGLLFPFNADFVIPKDDESFEYDRRIFKAAALKVLKEGDEPPPPGKAEELVYETMAQKAFESFHERLMAYFFTKDKDKD